MLAQWDRTASLLCDPWANQDIHHALQPPSHWSDVQELDDLPQQLPRPSCMLHHDSNLRQHLLLQPAGAELQTFCSWGVKGSA